MDPAATVTIMTLMTAVTSMTAMTAETGVKSGGGVTLTTLAVHLPRYLVWLVCRLRVHRSMTTSGKWFSCMCECA